VYPLDKTGNIYPRVLAQPNNYVKQRFDIANALATLSGQGHQLLLLTEHHIEFIDLCLSTSLGPNWQDFFALIICNTKKTLFTST
jgi:hypothetical protein